METWWPVEQTGLWFGLAGGGIGRVLGIGGAVVGAVLAHRARGRRLVVICMVVIALVGSPLGEDYTRALLAAAFDLEVIADAS